MTIGGLDAILASGRRGEIYINSIVASSKRCWVTLHILVQQDDTYDAYNDLQTWNEDSLVEFRGDQQGMYDLTLRIDGESTPIQFGHGNGGGLDESLRLRWTQCLTFPFDSSQNIAFFELRWDAMDLQGTYQIGIPRLAHDVAAGAY